MKETIVAKIMSISFKNNGRYYATISGVKKLFLTPNDSELVNIDMPKNMKEIEKMLLDNNLTMEINKGRKS